MHLHQCGGDQRGIVIMHTLGVAFAVTLMHELTQTLGLCLRR